MKRLLTVLLALAAALCLCFGLAACGGDGGSGGNGGEGSNGSGTGGNEDNTEVHEWSAWEVTKEASCTEEGSRTRTCSECGKVETETIPAKDHTYNKSNVCTVCGYELSPTVGLEYELYEETEYPQGEYYRVKGMGTATDQDLVIPAYHAGKQVKQIGSNAFNGKDALTSIYIPNGVEVIGMNAFSYCISLTSLRLPNSVKTIGKQAFYGCNKVQDITLGTNGITIGDGTFEGTAYYNDNKNWESGALYIGAHLIATNNDLPSVYTVKNGTRSIASRTFASRSKLEEIVISSAPVFGIDVFSNCGVTKANIPLGSASYLPASQIEELTVNGSYVSKDLDNFVNLKALFVNSDWIDTHSWSSSETPPLCNLTKLETLSVSWLKGSNRTYSIASLFGSVVPTSLQEVAVLRKTIPSYAFRGCSSLQKITLKNTITGIDSFAFVGCDVNINYEGNISQWLQVTKGNYWAAYEVTGGNSPIATSYISSFTFQQKTLDNLKIPDGTERIPAYSFQGVPISNIEIPASVSKISTNAFSRGYIEKITVDDSNEYFYGSMEGILYNKDKTEMILIPMLLKGKVDIPESITVIKDSAFSGCSGLTSIKIPDSVTEIGDQAFSGCSGLTGELKIPDSVTSIGDEAFSGCNGLTSIDIPDSVTSIGDYAFYNCSGLTSIVIPGSVTEIGILAFHGCSGLTSIVIPDSVESIGEWAFSECYKLVEVWNYSGLDLQPSSSDYGEVAYYAKHVYTTDEESKQTVTEEGYIFYEDGDEVYLLGYKGSETALTLPSTSPKGKAYKIYPYAFYFCNGLTSIVISDGVTSIGREAFEDCDGLTSVTIGSGVTSIGNHAFYGCNGLTGELKIPDSVTSIEESAFCDCSGLTSVTIGSGLTEIGFDVFCRCSGLTSVVIPDSVTSIGSYAFEGCRRLTRIEIPNSVTSIGAGAFMGCSGLTSVVIPDGVTEIGENAFYDCSGLTSVVIPDGVIGIGSYAFYYCSGLTSVTIGSGVTSIGNCAFAACSGLTGISVAAGNTVYRSEQNCLIENQSNILILGCKNSVIPNGVTSIGAYAFYGCSGLTSVIIPDSVTTIWREAFDHCLELTDIQFKGSVQEWQEIQKGYDWDSDTPDYTVTCTDGTVDKQGNVTYFNN